jgi:hypothetical protein
MVRTILDLARSGGNAGGNLLQFLSHLGLAAIVRTYGA